MSNPNLASQIADEVTAGTIDFTRAPTVAAVPTPTDDTASLLRSLKAIKLITDSLIGSSGSVLDKAVTTRDLLDQGVLAYSPSKGLYVTAATYVSGTTGSGGGSGGGAGGYSDPRPIAVVPITPTGLSASGAFKNIILSWDHDPSRNYAYTEIWRNTGAGGSNQGTATLLDTTEASVYVDGAITIGQTYWYWIKQVNFEGVSGPFNSSIGTPATTAIDVAATLLALTNQITEGQLYSALGARINLIDGAASLAGSVNARIATVQTTVDGHTSSINTLSGTTATAATDIITLKSQVNTTTGSPLYTAVQNEISTRVNADNSLFAQYTVKIDTNGYVSGFGLASTANNATPFSSFAVRADQFYIASPSGPGITPSMPFIVRTTGGTWGPAGVYVQDAYIANASIVNAKIQDAAIDNAKIASLDGAKINAGTITASQVAANSITAAKIDSTGLSIKDAAGNVVFSAGNAPVPLSYTRITPDTGWLNSALQPSIQSALDQLTNIASDSILTKGEKPQFILMWRAFKDEYINIVNVAAAAVPPVNITAYDTAYQAANTTISALSPSYLDLTQDTVTGSGLLQQLRDLTVERSALLHENAYAAIYSANSAQTIANQAATNLVNKLDKTAADTLSGVITANASTVSGLRAGNLVWDASGNWVSGSGVALTSKGILGHNGTNVTFAVNAYTGNAVFAGDISAATGTFSGSVSVNGATWTAGTGVYAGINSGFARFRVGTPGSSLTFDSSTGVLNIPYNSLTGVPANVSGARTPKVFRQATAPVTGDGLAAGDAWYQTDASGNSIGIYTYSGSAWVLQLRGPITATASGTVWDNTVAANAINAVFPGPPQVGDVVTISGTGFADTRMFQPNGRGWVVIADKINGSLLVTGSVSASAIFTTSLSALSANLGTVTAGTITGSSVFAGSLSAATGTFAGSVRGGNFTSFAFPASGGGFYLSSQGLLLGNGGAGSGQLYLELNADGSIQSPYLNVGAGGATFSGSLAAVTGNFNNLKINTGGTFTSASINGYNDIGTGFYLNSDGIFRLGTQTSTSPELGTFLKWDGGSLILNGPLVRNGSILAPTINDPIINNPTFGTLACSISPSSINVSGLSNTAVTYGSLSANVTSAGKTPYTYAWAVVSVQSGTSGIPVSLSISSASGASTSVTGSTVNNYIDGYVELTVTDANGRTATAQAPIHGGHGTAP